MVRREIDGSKACYWSSMGREHLRGNKLKGGEEGRGEGRGGEEKRGEGRGGEEERGEGRRGRGEKARRERGEGVKD